MNPTATSTTTRPVEKQAGECYTRKLFGMFQKKWTNNGGCGHEKLSKYVDGAMNLVVNITIRRYA